jgi:hypothetical protein
VGVFTEGNIIAVYSDTVAVGDILEIGAGGKLVPQDEGEGVAIALENGIAGETHQVKLQYTSAPASA